MLVGRIVSGHNPEGCTPVEGEGMPDQKNNDRLMQLFLLAVVILIVPIALNYGLDPGRTLPMTLDVKVEGTDQTHIFRALMCLYLGAAIYWGIGAFNPAWQRMAVIWAIFFAFSLAVGRVISLVVDGMPSPLLVVYLAIEIGGGLLGLAVLKAADRKIRR